MRPLLLLLLLPSLGSSTKIEITNKQWAGLTLTNSYLMNPKASFSKKQKPKWKKINETKEKLLSSSKFIRTSDFPLFFSSKIEFGTFFRVLSKTLFRGRRSRFQFVQKENAFIGFPYQSLLMLLSTLPNFHLLKSPKIRSKKMSTPEIEGKKFFWVVKEEQKRVL